MLAMHAQVVEGLAKICNGLTIDSIVCQGFTYDGNIAIFKGQSPNSPLDIKYDGCNSPGSKVTFWGLNAGGIWILPIIYCTNHAKMPFCTLHMHAYHMH